MDNLPDMKQGDAAWFAARLGKVTASRMADVTAKTKTGYGASRGNYMAELVVERLTGQPAPSYTNDAMRWGQEQEPVAKASYSFLRDVEIDAVGFVPHPKISMAGASPDGHIGKDGSIETKCPNSATHIDTLLGEPIADKYIKQIQWQLACSGRQWADFVSFDPRLPAEMQLFIQRIPRDDAMIVQLEKSVIDFLAELDAKVAELTARYLKDRAA